MKKRKKLKRIIQKAKQKSWIECAKVMRVEIDNQVFRQKYLNSIEIEALENEIKKLSLENKQLKKDYLKFLTLKNDLVYQSRKMSEATMHLNKDIMSIVQRFLKISDNCERIEYKHSKKIKKGR